MNHNNLYFITTVDAETKWKKRQCWLVSSPKEDEAQAHLVEAGWVDRDKTIVLTCEKVQGLVDTEDYMEGKTYVKLHN